MTDKPKPKRFKNLLSWYKNDATSESGSGSGSGSGIRSETGSRNVDVDSVNDVMLEESPSIPQEESPAVECHSDRIEIDNNFDITALERDPGIRKPICSYPQNLRDCIRRAYMVLGPYQPVLASYPSSWDGVQGRNFCKKWYKSWQWLEYSVELDKAYCFPCFLFDSYPSHHLIVRVESFCCEHGIKMPDMSAPYKKGRERDCAQSITKEHYYRVTILNSVIDFQLRELDSRFTDQSLELLILSGTLDPRDNFQAFNPESVHNLASKFYPMDFLAFDMVALDMECGYFLADVQRDDRFVCTASLSDLCRRLIESRKAAFFPMIYRLICLVLTLPVSTATTERAFSSMNILKNKLRNKMEDDFLDDLMVLYIEKEFADSIENDSVIEEFEKLGRRRVDFA